MIEETKKLYRELVENNLNDQDVVINDDTGIVIVNDSTNTSMPSVVRLLKALNHANLSLEVININMRAFEGLNDRIFEHDILDLIQPRSRGNYYKIVVAAFGNRALCDKIDRICDEDFRCKESA